MKFRVKDAEYPQTFFIGGQAIRLEPDEEYETDDPAVIEELKAHGGFAQARGGRGKNKDDDDE